MTASPRCARPYIGAARQRSTPRRLLTRAAVVAALLSGGGCTLYHPHPLDEKASLPAGVEQLLTQDAQRGDTARVHAVDPRDGLDLVEIGMLAAINDPDLVAARREAHVAGAQAFAAGLLPDPQLGFGIDRPTGDAAGLVDARTLSLGYDIVPLITHQAAVDAARSAHTQVRLDLLWQEWQTIQHAQMLAVRLGAEREQLRLLRELRDGNDARYRRSSRALQRGDITLDVSGTDLAALVDTQSQINQLEQQHNATRHALNLALGLAPQAIIALAPLPPPAPLDAAAVQRQLRRLPQLRPDLRALQAGYASQEARVRGAVLAQFPALGISVNRANDTSDVKTVGVSVSLNLPLFSGNRGNIAIERATRAQLHDAYSARLEQARSEVDQLLALQALLDGYRHTLDARLPQLQTLAQRARRAYAKGDIDAPAYLNIESTWVNKRLEQIRLRQSAWENRLALDTLLVLPAAAATTRPQAAAGAGGKP